MLSTRADLLFLLGENERARESYETAIALARSGGDPRSEATATLQLASLHRHLNELDQAFVRLIEAEALTAASKDRRGMALALLRRGQLHYSLNETSEAVTSLERAIALLQGSRRSEI